MCRSRSKHQALKVYTVTNILILGAHGQIARVATDLLLKQTDVRLTLNLRNAWRLKLSSHADRVCVMEGDVLDTKTLEAAMAAFSTLIARQPAISRHPGLITSFCGQLG
jgi:saccharopine dehydrogenase-like NADP-dependent oxidoreductase